MAEAEPVSSKRCIDCRRDRPLTVFCRHAGTKSGLSPYCRECSTQRGREWRKANPQKQAAIQAKYLRARKLRSVGLIPARSAA